MEKTENSKINGQLTSLAFSDLGTYSIDYLTNGNIDSITYPNSQGEETYTYGGGKGRLSQIEYPNDDTLEFDWNDKDEVSRITYTDYATQTETRYTMTYTPNHEVATLTQSIDSVQQYVWTFSWAPNGLEKAVKTVNSQPTLTQDFTTDPQGRILSMTYDTIGEGYDGELYFHYDHFGNTTLLTDTNGSPVFSAQYNPCRGTTLQTWNTNNLEIMNQGLGRSGTIFLTLPASVTALVASSRTITISEEVISAFVARYGTNLVCYVEDYGPQSSVNGNPDENPCGSGDCESFYTMSCDTFYYQFTTNTRFIDCIIQDRYGACLLIGRCDHQAREILTIHKECQQNPVTKACWDMYNG